jgi:CRISPR-associated protein (TIGR03986 family)
MTWLEGTIEEFKGGKPEHRDRRKIRTDPRQDWNDLYYFHVLTARSAGYPDSALAAGSRIRFEPDEKADRPRVGRFAPYEPPKSSAAASSFLNPYHFIGLVAPSDDSLKAASDYLETEPLHDRFGSSDAPPGSTDDARYSGRIVCRLTTEGPVVVGSTQRRPDGRSQEETPVTPFELPHPDRPGGPNRPAVPGSTLRGLLSSLVETASCSAMRVLPDRSFTRRADLGKESLSAIGRLEDHEGKLRLRPLTLSLDEMTRQTSSGGYPPKERCRVFVNGYDRARGIIVHRDESFLARHRPNSHSASCDEYWYLDLDKTHWHGSRGLTLGLMAEADPIPETAWQALGEDEKQRFTRGVLLVLGLDGSKAGNLPPTKKHEAFLPFPPPPEDEDPKTSMLEIPAAVKKELEALLEDSAGLPRGGETDDLPYLHAGRERGGGPPKPRAGDLVYYEPDPRTGTPRHLAYSAVWRRPVAGESLHQAVSLVSEDLVPFHSGRSRLTLAERLFGFVEANGKRALAGRVRVANALAERGPDEGSWYDPPVTLKILASPKPPSPALYFGNHDYLAKRDLNLSKHPPQGRKAYLHHREEDVKAGCYGTNDDDPSKRHLRMRVTPLKPGTRFLFHLDFTNLTAKELGHLLYALRPQDRFRHQLGMGKPLGLGRVVIDPLALAFADRHASYRPEGLFGPRWASVEWLQAPSEVEWENLPAHLERRYRAELAAAEDGAPRQERFPAAGDLRRRVRDAIPEAVRWPLELLGDPAQVQAEVTYPVLADQTTEGEHFRWFVENDKTHHQALPAIGPGDALPTLKRHSKPETRPRQPGRGRRP